MEVLPHEHGETGTTLDQSTPRKQRPSQQKGKKGAKRVTFGGILLREFEEEPWAPPPRRGA